MFLSPELITWIFIGAISFCAFMIWLNWGRQQTNDIIDQTVMYLINEGYVKARKDFKGEWELIPSEEK